MEELKPTSLTDGKISGETLFEAICQYRIRQEDIRRRKKDAIVHAQAEAAIPEIVVGQWKKKLAALQQEAKANWWSHISPSSPMFTLLRVLQTSPQIVI